MRYNSALNDSVVASQNRRRFMRDSTSAWICSRQVRPEHMLLTGFPSALQHE